MYLVGNYRGEQYLCHLMSKLDAMAIEAIVYAKPRIVTIHQIRLFWEATFAIASFSVLKVESIEVTQDCQRQRRLIGGVSAINIWSVNLLLCLADAINDPAKQSYLRSDSLCC